MATNHDNQSDDALNLLWGIAAIGKAIGRSPRQTQYLLSTGRIPAQRIGEQYVIERSTLIAFFKGEAA